MVEKRPLISAEVEELLHAAFVKCREERHTIITVEHLLLALLYSDSLNSLWSELGTDIERLRRWIAEFISENTPITPGTEEVDTQPTLGFQRVVQRAIMWAQTKRNTSVRPVEVLLAIFGEKDSHAVSYLTKSNVTRDAVVTHLSGNKISASSTQKAPSANNENALTKKIQQVESAILMREKGQQPRGKVFVSYSHADTDCLQRLLVHLKPLEKSKAINCWSDLQIRIGDKWKGEIQKNLDEAVIAILLISADFLASDFIVNNELPPLLMAADTKGIRILPVILKPCGFLRDPVLSSFQAVNDPRGPLLGMPHIQQEEVYDKIAGEVSSEMQRRNSR